MTQTPNLPPDNPTPPPPRRLLRSESDKVIGGLCGGFADYVGVDATVLRVGAVLLAVVSCGAAVIGYLLALLVVPTAHAAAVIGPRRPPVG